MQHRLVVWLQLENIEHQRGDDPVPLPVLVDTGFNDTIYLNRAHLYAAGVDPVGAEVDASANVDELSRLRAKTDGAFLIRRQLFRLRWYPEVDGLDHHQAPDPEEHECITLSDKVSVIVEFSNSKSDRARPPILGMKGLELLKAQLIVDYNRRVCDVSVTTA